jgi:hypothetical protein
MITRGRLLRERQTTEVKEQAKAVTDATSPLIRSHVSFAGRSSWPGE